MPIPPTVPFPPDYQERVYAGVLGKIIGVYMGRPVEGWTHERIMSELGEIRGYIHERLKLPLIVTDDDITGTFTFLRALEDHAHTPDLSSAQIGQAWLNYIVPDRTILWWGGLGNSTEHTAYLRLASGIEAPRSGSAELNGQILAEQIGAQIFIDGWAMVAPGNPELAVRLATRAARVSHDGDAVDAARLIAAMEAMAFTEPDLHRLLEAGLGFVARSGTIARLVDDLRRWCNEEADWRETRLKVAAHYGYSKYPGVCPVVPNHALVLMSLLYAPDDFMGAMTIVNTSGWDTDCNAGNVGCLLGIKNGLAGLDTHPELRGPVADRIYLPSADGSRALSDALTEAGRVVNAGRGLAGLAAVHPKGGARYHFSLPGSVQGFVGQAENPHDLIVENALLENAPLGPSSRALALRYRGLGPERSLRAATATFTPPDALEMPGYELLASPSLHPGQELRATVIADIANPGPVEVRLSLGAYTPADSLVRLLGPAVWLEPGQALDLGWVAPDPDGQPLMDVGLEVAAPVGEVGTVFLERLDWGGAPSVRLGRPSGGGSVWRRAWVNAVDHFDPQWTEAFRLAQDRGTGMLSQGGLGWRDYRASTQITPLLLLAGGLAVRVGGMRRHYALRLEPGWVRLVKTLHVEAVLAEAPLEWLPGQPVELDLEAVGSRLTARVDGRVVFEVQDREEPLESGGVAFVVREGTLSAQAITVRPAGR